MNIIKRVALWLDYGLNTARGGLPTEPISARVWRKLEMVGLIAEGRAAEILA